MNKRTNSSLLTMSAMVAALTAVGAWVTIPLPTPVPFTLQVFFVLSAGLLLGPAWGATSQVVYVLLGAFGLPVFSGGTGGFSVLTGPTGGYLLGFIVAAWICGMFYKWFKNYFGAVLGTVAGLIAIYVLGVAQLAIISGMTLRKAIMAGFVPFIALDAFKAIAACWLIPQLGNRLEKAKRASGSWEDPK